MIKFPPNTLAKEEFLKLLHFARQDKERMKSFRRCVTWLNRAGGEGATCTFHHDFAPQTLGFNICCKRSEYTLSGVINYHDFDNTFGIHT